MTAGSPFIGTSENSGKRQAGRAGGRNRCDTQSGAQSQPRERTDHSAAACRLHLKLARIILTLFLARNEICSWRKKQSPTAKMGLCRQRNSRDLFRLRVGNETDLGQAARLG